jgi:hypothetical protein
VCLGDLALDTGAGAAGGAAKEPGVGAAGDSGRSEGRIKSYEGEAALERVAGTAGLGGASLLSVDGEEAGEGTCSLAPSDRGSSASPEVSSNAARCTDRSCAATIKVVSLGEWSVTDWEVLSSYRRYPSAHAPLAP